MYTLCILCLHCPVNYVGQQIFCNLWDRFSVHAERVLLQYLFFCCFFFVPFSPSVMANGFTIFFSIMFFFYNELLHELVGWHY